LRIGPLDHLAMGRRAIAEEEAQALCIVGVTCDAA
jgi:hypothetical protein